MWWSPSCSCCSSPSTTSRRSRRGNGGEGPAAETLAEDQNTNSAVGTHAERKGARGLRQKQILQAMHESVLLGGQGYLVRGLPDLLQLPRQQPHTPRVRHFGAGQQAFMSSVIFQCISKIAGLRIHPGRKKELAFQAVACLYVFGVLFYKVEFEVLNSHSVDRALSGVVIFLQVFHYLRRNFHLT